MKDYGLSTEMVNVGTQSYSDIKRFVLYLLIKKDNTLMGDIMKIECKITSYITGLDEEENDKLARWGNTFGKNHGKYPDEKGFHSLCVEHMTDNIDDPAAYCARVKDAWYGSTFWRGKEKSDKQVKSDVKNNTNYPKGKRKLQE